MWLLASSFLFYKYLLQVSPGVMLPQLMHEFVLNGAQIGNLTAFLLCLLMQLPVGVLLDQYRLQVLLPFATAVCALGALLFDRLHVWLSCVARCALVSVAVSGRGHHEVNFTAVSGETICVSVRVNDDRRNAWPAARSLWFDG